MDWNVSALALGTAFLPLVDAEAIAMVRYAIDRGVNYLDIRYTPDIQRRESISRLVGRALQDGYREKIKIALALPSRNINSTADLDDYLQQQLDWLQVASADFCLPGWLDRQIWPGLKEKGILDWGESVLAGGRANHLGFCFHDDYQTLRTILDAYDNWTLCQIQYSYMDVDHHPGIGGIRYAADKGLAVVVAEPLKSGRLTRNVPHSVAEVWGEKLNERSPAEWGLRAVWHHPEVATVVSDVGTLEQLQENINLADIASEDTLTVQEQILVNRVRDAYRALEPINCTACRGCMPCPQDVDAPRIFELFNDAVIYDDVGIPQAIYREEGHEIDKCDQCGRCEEACGRNITICDWLEKAQEIFKN